jgi:hypothetical protein
MKNVSVKMLRKLGACEPTVFDFEVAFGTKPVPITPANVQKALAAGLGPGLEWLVNRLPAKWQYAFKCRRGRLKTTHNDNGVNCAGCDAVQALAGRILVEQARG